MASGEVHVAIFSTVCQLELHALPPLRTTMRSSWRINLKIGPDVRGKNLPSAG